MHIYFKKYQNHLWWYNIVLDFQGAIYYLYNKLLPKLIILGNLLAFAVMPNVSTWNIKFYIPQLTKHVSNLNNIWKFCLFFTKWEAKDSFFLNITKILYRSSVYIILPNETPTLHFFLHHEFAEFSKTFILVFLHIIFPIRFGQIRDWLRKRRHQKCCFEFPALCGLMYLFTHNGPMKTNYFS